MEKIEGLISLLTGGDDEQAETAALELAALGAQALPPLQTLLSNGDLDARWWALRTLSEISDPTIPPLLISALHDPDRALRECAALGLRRQPDPAAIPDLLVCLQGQEAELSRLAGDALIAIGAQATPALIEVLKNGSQAARLAAVRVLAVIADPRSIPALFEALSEDSALMEYWANEGLEKMGVGMTFFKT